MSRVTFPEPPDKNALAAQILGGYLAGWDPDERDEAIDAIRRDFVDWDDDEEWPR